MDSKSQGSYNRKYDDILSVYTIICLGDPGWIARARVSMVENMIISYFQPVYMIIYLGDPGWIARARVPMVENMIISYLFI